VAAPCKKRLRVGLTAFGFFISFSETRFCRRRATDTARTSWCFFLLTAV